MSLKSTLKVQEEMLVLCGLPGHFASLFSFGPLAFLFLYQPEVREGKEGKLIQISVHLSDIVNPTVSLIRERVKM